MKTNRLPKSWYVINDDSKTETYEQTRTTNY